MQTTIYYVLRSRKDGQYLTADPERRSPSSPGGAGESAGGRPKDPTDGADGPPKASPGFLIVFQEHADGLTYLNTHAPDFAADFAVESMTQSQLKQMMQRWQFAGLGVVSDPLLPRVQFMRR